MTVPDRCRPRLPVAQGWQSARLLTVWDEPRRGRAPRCNRVSARRDACPGQGRRGTHRTRSLAGPRGRRRPPGGRSAAHTPSPAPCVTDRWLGPSPAARARTRGVWRGATHGRGRRREVVPGRHTRTYHGHRAGGGCRASRAYAGTDTRPSRPPAFLSGLVIQVGPPRAAGMPSAREHPPRARSLLGVVVLTRKNLLLWPRPPPPIALSGLRPRKRASRRGGTIGPKCWRVA